MSLGKRYLPGQVPGDMTNPVMSQGWFQWLRTWMKSTNDVKVAQTVSFNAGQEFLYPCDATAGNIVVTLPAANSQNGKKYVFKKTDSSANTVTVTAAGTDTIDGVATLVLTLQYQQAHIASDGISSWWELSAKATGIGLQSPLTTKGDIWGFDTANNRIPIGTNGFVLTADSTQALGLKWAVGGGVNPSTVYTATGAFTYNVPTGTVAVDVLMVGGGAAGGGCPNTGQRAAGGGGSAEAARYRMAVTSGGTLAGVVGAKGVGVSGAKGGDGTATTVGNFSVAGGLGGNVAGAAAPAGGAGGGRLGGAGGTGATPGNPGVAGGQEGFNSIGGSGGGGAGTNNANAAGGAGGTNESNAGGAGGAGTALPAPGGGGGGASIFGPGGIGAAGNTGAAGGAAPAANYGSAGGASSCNGTGATTGGNGADGIVIITPLY